MGGGKATISARFERKTPLNVEPGFFIQGAAKGGALEL
jgi:hypothetical protein